jgi:hypothetical protein
MAQARLAPSSRVGALCQQVLRWAGPLTSSPSLMLPALRVVLEALLMSDEANPQNERRVYSRCLEVIVAPDDAESLSLLAEVAFREQRYADGCRHCARSWRAGGTLMPNLLAAWQAGSAHWAGTTPPPVPEGSCDNAPPGAPPHRDNPFSKRVALLGTTLFYPRNDKIIDIGLQPK